MDAFKAFLFEAKQFLTEIVQEAMAQQAATPAKPQPSEVEDRYFTIKELHDYLPGHPPIATIYAWSSKGTIPKTLLGRRVVFRKSLIDKWLLEKRCPTNNEIGAIPIPRKKRK